jgi:hypothetical protein
LVSDIKGGRLRIFENRVLRRIFGPKGDEVTGGLKELYKEELHKFDSLASIIRMIVSMSMKWARNAAIIRRR